MMAIAIRQDIVDVLRKTGLAEVAGEAARLLPDPADLDHVAGFPAAEGRALASVTGAGTPGLRRAPGRPDEAAGTDMAGGGPARSWHGSKTGRRLQCLLNFYYLY